MMEKNYILTCHFTFHEVASRKCVFHFNCTMTLFASLNECKVISVKMQVDFQFNVSMNNIVLDSTKMRQEKKR